MSDRLRHVARVLNQPWAITPDMFAIVCQIIDRRIAGVRLHADEIEEAVADSRDEFVTRHAATSFPGSSSQQDRVAVISLYGTILPRPVSNISGGGSAGLTQFMDAFRQADADPTVKQIVIDIDSPGGSADLVPEAAALVRGAQTPTTAVANTMAASAAYWIASQADELVVSPSGSVGSIGVFARHVDASAALEMDGLNVTLISAGRYKTEGNPYEPLSADAEAAIQSMVDECYAAFVGAVAAARGVTDAEVTEGFGEGRMVSAYNAVACGMADRVATFDDVIQQALTTSTSGFHAAQDSPALSAEARLGGADKPAPVSGRIARLLNGR